MYERGRRKNVYNGPIHKERNKGWCDPKSKNKNKTKINKITKRTDAHARYLTIFTEGKKLIKISQSHINLRCLVLMPNEHHLNSNIGQNIIQQKRITNNINMKKKNLRNFWMKWICSINWCLLQSRKKGKKKRTRIVFQIFITFSDVNALYLFG